MVVAAFPGQGSQRPAMGVDWQREPSWELVERASDIVGRDIGRLLLEAGEFELRRADNAQLSTFVISLVALQALTERGLAPAVCIGHSLGEYTALVAAGILGFDDGIRLVAERGDAMQAVCETTPGAMAAVSGLASADVELACSRAGGSAFIASHNAPGHTVIAGSPRAVVEASDEAVELGASQVELLAVAGAFHTFAMAPAQERLRAALASVCFHPSTIPVVANVDAQFHAWSDKWTQILTAQLCTPVRWRQSVSRIVNDGHIRFVAVGPGSGRLARFVNLTAPEVAVGTVQTPLSVDRLFEQTSSVEGRTAFSQTGEVLHVAERLVISPFAGLFQPAPAVNGDRAGSERLEVGQLIGTVSGEPVRSAFTGSLMGLLALPGERVRTGQPVAWLRV